MAWLAGGVVYSVVYLLAGFYLRGNAHALVWLRISALLLPPLAGIFVIARRRRDWTGCQWLFWATVALGLSMTAIGIVGWTVDEVLLARETSWLGWYTVFALFGAIAPLFALLAQPHRGTRQEMTASTAVDIAGIAVMTGFLYSHFVMGSDLEPLATLAPSVPLVLLQEFQQFLVCAALVLATIAAKGSSWVSTYRRLAVGLMVGFTILTISNLGILQGLYRSGGVYDVIWILPFAFFAWAASAAPGSGDEESTADSEFAAAPSRPWVVFAALGALPLVDFGLRRVIPIAPALEGFRDLSMVITIFSVLPLLIARLAVENSDARRADQRRQLLAAATEQAGDLISIMTPAGEVEYANTAFCRALGLDQKEIGHMMATDLLAADSRPQFDAIRLEVPAAPWRGTLIRRRQDESTFLSDCSIVALTDGAGRLRDFVAVERDSTHETELRDQLIHSERLAAVGQLVSGVAHELNNPLQSIIGFTELLLAAERRQEVRSDLDQIHAAARRAAKIVHNLLGFVRRSSAERAPANLNEIVQSTVALRRYELATTGVELKEHYENRLPPVLVSREEIQQIILNIVLNAEQAMKSAGLRGCLSVRTFCPQPSEVAIEIQDDGPGVPAALAGKIFEPFFSTKGVGEGTGLGLSLALGIAEAHGGTLALIPVSSGACFRLTLPASVCPPPAEDDVTRPAAAPSLNGKRALVVDDEPGLRQLLERLLAQRGFSVDVAEDGDAAAGMLQRRHYDVIFSDVQMPKMSGMAFFDWMRANRPKSTSAFVFVMGGLMTPELQSAIDRDRVPVLSKPFGAASLDALLADLFPEPINA